MKKRYVAAGVSVLLFVAAQSFQELSYRFWIPAPNSPQDELLTYLLPIDQVRAVLIMATIVLLIVPCTVIALRYFKVAPLASILGLVFGAVFIGFEFSHRSVDMFVVGAKWAHELRNAASGAESDAILQRFRLWNEIARGWYFPLMVSYLLASCAFATATWNDRLRGGVYYLAPIAYALNALRLTGRVLSTFGGQHWLDGLNDKLYFPVVSIINAMLVVWFFALAREREDLSDLRPRS